MEQKSEIVRRTFVESKLIENITEEEFLDSINLSFKDTISICFYDETKEAQHALRSFVSAADTVEGLKFGVANLDFEKKIIKRFKNLDDEDNPYYWARYNHAPFILTYRMGFPQAFYNGFIDDKSLKFYFENLSHVKGYKEQLMLPTKSQNEENTYLRTTYD